MKTIQKVAFLSVPLLIISYIGFLNTLLWCIFCMGVYYTGISLQDSTREIEGNLDIIEREDEEAIQDTIDEVDAFLMESINRRQNNLVIISKEKED
jgi:hypothetical protein